MDLSSKQNYPSHGQEAFSIFSLFISVFLFCCLASYSRGLLTQPPFRQAVSENWCGAVGYYIAEYLLNFLGATAYIPVFVLFCVSILALFPIRFRDRLPVVATGITGLIVSTCGLLAVAGTEIFPRHYVYPGGYLGEMLGDFLTRFIGAVGAMLLLLTTFVFSLMGVMRFSPLETLEWLFQFAFGQRKIFSGLKLPIELRAERLLNVFEKYRGPVWLKLTSKKISWHAQEQGAREPRLLAQEPSGFEPSVITKILGHPEPVGAGRPAESLADRARGARTEFSRPSTYERREVRDQRVMREYESEPDRQPANRLRDDYGPAPGDVVVDESIRVDGGRLEAEQVRVAPAAGAGEVEEQRRGEDRNACACASRHESRAAVHAEHGGGEVAEAGVDGSSQWRAGASRQEPEPQVPEPHEISTPVHGSTPGHGDGDLPAAGVDRMAARPAAHAVDNINAGVEGQGKAHGTSGELNDGYRRAESAQTAYGPGDENARQGGVEPSRTEPSRTEPSQTEPNRTESSQTEPSRAEPVVDGPGVNARGVESDVLARGAVEPGMAESDQRLYASREDAEGATGRRAAAEPAGESGFTIHQPEAVKMGGDDEPRKSASFYNIAEYELPPLSLLDQHEERDVEVDEHHYHEVSKLLERKLLDFSVKGRVEGISPGPVVTTYEYAPAPGVKINKIVSLSDDLAMVLKVDRVRIVGSIPGKAALGIEIPNPVRRTVYMREILQSEAYQQAKSRLSLALGLDVVGQPVIADLAKMPHLLIAGATGAGKSVAINAFIASILYKSTPAEVKMLMIDPKRIELSVYDNIPHLLHPVVVEPKMASRALVWAVREMERRYRLLEEKRVKSFKSYNMVSEEKLPYIIIIVDELADLMMVASKDVEMAIARLAQMARAAGMHIILATQRPSVDVLTGLIKANFPTRISFKVSSKVDSRTIIDSSGAEHLLGAGDMLFLPPGAAKLQRIHGAYIDEKETDRIIEYLKQQGSPYYDEEVMKVVEEDATDAGGEQEDYDEKYDEAVAVVCETGQASISMVQRRLRVGYNRAARMIEVMEREGIVGPADGSRPRDVLVRNDYSD